MQAVKIQTCWIQQMTKTTFCTERDAAETNCCCQADSLNPLEEDHLVVIMEIIKNIIQPYTKLLSLTC